MKINFNNVSLTVSAGHSKQFLRNAVPQIAFSGRSNVGKSSLINSLLNRKSFARVSSMPGKTITINFYDIDSKLFFVDLPGYGYAKRTLDEKVKWSSLVNDYFTNNTNIDLLKLVVQLIDMRTGFSDDDYEMISFLKESSIPFIIVGTKSDKLSKTAKESAAVSLSEKAGISVIPFSSVTKEGKNEILSEILRNCN